MAEKITQRMMDNNNVRFRGVARYKQGDINDGKVAIRIAQKEKQKDASILQLVKKLGK